MKKEIKDFCIKHNVTEKQFFGREKVGGYLYLSSLTSIPEGFNPTVGGSLYLSSLTSIPEGFNPTVGGYLYLRSLTSIPEGFNPTVGGSLDLRSGLSAQKRPYEPRILSWENGKYISVDGIFSEVVSKKGNTYTVKKLHSFEHSFIVTDGKSTHAHGKTLEEAKEDFRYKRNVEKLKKEPLTMNTKVTIERYRAITGACRQGVENWMNQNNMTNDFYLVKDLLPVLERTNAFGVSQFKKLIQ